MLSCQRSSCRLQLRQAGARECPFYVKLTYVEISASRFSASLRGNSNDVVFGRTRYVMVTFTQKHVGAYSNRIELIFEDIRLRQRFVIVRPLDAVVGNEADYTALQPQQPYIPRKRTSRDPEADIVAGDPPPALRAVPYVVKLPQAHIPDYITHSLSHPTSLAIMTKQIKSHVLPRTFDDASYGRYFKVLLWAEEHRSEYVLPLRILYYTDRRV